MSDSSQGMKHRHINYFAMSNLAGRIYFIVVLISIGGVNREYPNIGLYIYILYFLLYTLKHFLWKSMSIISNYRGIYIRKSWLSQQQLLLENITWCFSIFEYSHKKQNYLWLSIDMNARICFWDHNQLCLLPDRIFGLFRVLHFKKVNSNGKFLWRRSSSLV